MPQIQCSLSYISTHLTFFTSYFLSNWTPVFGSKVKIMPHCHPLVCIHLNHEPLSFSLSLLLFFNLFNYLPHIPFWQCFACLSALQTPTYPSPAAPSPSRGLNQRPESYLFRLSQREEKKKGLFTLCSSLLLCGKCVMSWLIMIRIQYCPKVWGR